MNELDLLYECDSRKLRKFIFKELVELIYQTIQSERAMADAYFIYTQDVICILLSWQINRPNYNFLDICFPASFSQILFHTVNCSQNYITSGISTNSIYLWQIA